MYLGQKIYIANTLLFYFDNIQRLYRLMLRFIKNLMIQTICIKSKNDIVIMSFSQLVFVTLFKVSTIPLGMLYQRTVLSSMQSSLHE